MKQIIITIIETEDKTISQINENSMNETKLEDAHCKRIGNVVQNYFKGIEKLIKK